MKWLSFATAGRECFGFVVGDANVVDYRDAVHAAGGETQIRSLLELVEAGGDEWASAREIAGRIEAGELVVDK